MATAHNEPPLRLPSSRLPASANSLLGASMSIPPAVHLGCCSSPVNIGVQFRFWGKRTSRGRATDCAEGFFAWSI